jgi:acyl-homoserine lactone acylase PvdQ
MELSRGRNPDEQMLTSLRRAIHKLETDFGTWETPWGDINRYQRINGDIRQPFDDSLPSLPVDFASSRWGSLASFGARSYPGTKKMYGTSGNSFVAIVEFGEKIKAKSILAGGISGNPDSPHFNDQALMYTKGQFKNVLFYREDVEAKAESSYHPGK